MKARDNALGDALSFAKITGATSLWERRWLITRPAALDSRARKRIRGRCMCTPARIGRFYACAYRRRAPTKRFSRGSHSASAMGLGKSGVSHLQIAKAWLRRRLFLVTRAKLRGRVTANLPPRASRNFRKISRVVITRNVEASRLFRWLKNASIQASISFVLRNMKMMCFLQPVEKCGVKGC